MGNIEPAQPTTQHHVLIVVQDFIQIDEDKQVAYRASQETIWMKLVRHCAKNVQQTRTAKNGVEPHHVKFVLPEDLLIPALQNVQVAQRGP